MKSINLVCIIGVSLLFLSSCAPRIIPIQMARITHVENYKEYYKFDDAQRARDVLEKVVGKQNWLIIEEHYVFGNVVQDLLDGRFIIEGSLIFTMSLNPKNTDQFFIEGMGKYHVHRNTKNEVILSADYTIINDKPFSITELKEKNYMELHVKRFYTRHFAAHEKNYYNDIPLKFRIHVKELRENLYTVDYDRRHEVWIADQQMGEIEFQPPYNHKVIDLRGLEYLRNDY